MRRWALDPAFQGPVQHFASAFTFGFSEFVAELLAAGFFDLGYEFGGSRCVCAFFIEVECFLDLILEIPDLFI